VAETDQGYLLGRIAVQLKLITMDQLVEATKHQERTGAGKRLGDILVEQGLITPVQLETIARIQREYLAKRRAMQAGGLQPLHPVPAADAAAAPTGAPRPRAAAGPAVPETPRPPREGETGVAPRPGTTGAVGARRPARLEALLARAVQSRASDVHIHAGAPIAMRIHGRLQRGDGPALTARDTEPLLLEILSPEQRSQLEEQGEIDLAYTIPEVGRFRANLYRQQRGMDGVFRAIPPSPPSLLDLGLPTTLAKFTTFHQGMVLVTGPAGCGKSSTLAAFIDIINEERRDHILTIEDPIEYLHPSKRCVVNQRQVVRHTESFARALRAALREDPDVIAIGELRDLETISLALTAAETGHLVLATLHTNNAIRTINRLLGVFPPSQQSQVRTMLSESLRAIVSQRLLPSVDGTRRVPALEVLIVNKAVGNLIRENKTFQIRSVLQTGAAHGMGLLDNSLADLVKAGVISRDEAIRNCDDPKRFAA
jgi:twitching motility protein PilT